MTNDLDPITLMLFAHFLADYPLQGDFLSKAKNETKPIEGVPWRQAMMAHCVIHAGFVYIITGSGILAIMELAVHWYTDRAKCRGCISYDMDQLIHILSKFAWGMILFSGILESFQ